MGPWITPAVCLQDIADYLKQSPDLLDPLWGRIAEQAVNDGYTDLTDTLLARGYLIDQLDSWDNRIPASRDQSLFRAMIRGAGLGEYNPKYVEMLDRREYLSKVATIMIAGAAVAPPGTSEVGGISSAQLTEKANVERCRPSIECRMRDVFHGY